MQQRIDIMTLATAGCKAGGIGWRIANPPQAASLPHARGETADPELEPQYRRIMRINPEDLRRHYVSLSDEALKAISPADLSEIARPIYSAELSRRAQLADTESVDETDADLSMSLEDAVDEEDFELDSGPEPEWLEHAFCACTFAMPTGGRQGGAQHAEQAREVLRDNGIPCRLTMGDDEPPTMRLMVPLALTMHATSILDRLVFNDDLEIECRAHFEMLSDTELRALKPEIFCAGLLDRVARLRRAYEDEIATRKMRTI